MATEQQLLDAQKLLQQGDILGQQSSQLTGISYTPIAPTLSSSTLQGTTPINYNQSENVTIPNINPAPESPPETPPATPINDSVSKMINEAMGLQTNVAGENAYRQEQFKAQGITPVIDENGNTIYQNKTLVDLQGQLKKLSAESLQIPLQLQQDFAGRGVTTGGLQPIQKGMLRNNAIASLGVQAQIAGQKDNIILARNLVEQMVTIKYGQAEADLKAKLANIDLLLKDPKITRENEARADYRALKLRQEQNKLDQAKEDSTTIASWAIAMGKYQPTDPSKPKPTALEIDNVMKLAKSDDPDKLKKALAIYAKYSNDPQATQKAANELAIQRLTIQQKTDEIAVNTAKSPVELAQAKANLAKTKAEIEKIYAEANGTSPDSVSSGNIDGDVKDILEGRNTMYNIRQTMGRTNKAAAYMESVRRKIRAIDSGFDFVASDAGGKSVSSQYVQRATASINAVLPNIKIITDLSNQVGRIGIKGVDSLLQKGGTQINNVKIANFRQAQKLIADEIGVALGAGTVSDMKLQLGFDVTDPSVSQEVFASNMELVKEFLENRKKGLNSLRYSSSTTKTNDTTKSGKAFDYAAAKNAGYTDAEIQAYLNAN